MSNGNHSRLTIYIDRHTRMAKKMKRLTILLCFALVGCGQEDKANTKEKEKKIGSELTSRTVAIANDIGQSRKFYVVAYKNLRGKSHFNNQLFICTVNQIDSFIDSYKMNHESFVKDIRANKKMTIETVDGLCIMNKFIKKYSTYVDLRKAPTSLREDTRRALQYQSMYLRKLKSKRGHFLCLNLK